MLTGFCWPGRDHVKKVMFSPVSPSGHVLVGSAVGSCGCQGSRTCAGSGAGCDLRSLSWEGTERGAGLRLCKDFSGD